MTRDRCCRHVTPSCLYHDLWTTILKSSSNQNKSSSDQNNSGKKTNCQISKPCLYLTWIFQHIQPTNFKGKRS
jgi:hypothetical protein